MKKFSVLMLAVIMMLGFVSCGDSGGGEVADTTKPTIAITSPNSDGTTVVTAGSDLAIAVTITDDKELASWKWDVTAPATAKKNTFSWEHSGTTQTISGESANVTDTFEWDDTQTTLPKLGTYTLTVTATDVAGNTQTATATFEVENAK